MTPENCRRYVLGIRKEITILEELIKENPDPNDKYFSFIAQKHVYECALESFISILEYERETEKWSITGFIKELIGKK